VVGEAKHCPSFCIPTLLAFIAGKMGEGGRARAGIEGGGLTFFASLPLPRLHIAGYCSPPPPPHRPISALFYACYAVYS